ncbi:DUF5085 domain-containing protein [Heyndrickxia sporothermodurans]|uniref:DUF5085 family protein n=1 Tax=Heyndrickxia sporothermodurans TaxID=46224 RepID=UPI000D366A83|nr:DUF5085 family protein [Heyndrickxia sporothermodurans]PTY77956.1 DUF5085 domain-containing protein [Heyndrickxia sporothermodurans]
MINPKDAIRYTNVLSKRVYFHYTEIDSILKQFLHEVIQQKARIKGPLFYSITNVPMDEMVHAELFMPIKEDSIVTMEDYYFHSYYNVEDMLSICLFDHFEQKTEIAYHMLLDYIEHNGLNQITPFYHVISGDEIFQYVFIKVGVSS